MIWPDLVPSGQRNIYSDTSMYQKNVKSFVLIFPDGEKLPLNKKQNDVSEDICVVLFCALLGVMCGIRNKMYAGLVLAASLNTPDELKEGGLYYDCEVELHWDGKKVPVREKVSRLLDINHALATTINNSIKELGYEDLAHNKRKKKRKQEKVELTEEEMEELFSMEI